MLLVTVPRAPDRRAAASVVAAFVIADGRGFLAWRTTLTRILSCSPLSDEMLSASEVFIAG